MGAVDESAVYKSIMASVTKIQAESVHGTVNLASVNATLSPVELVAAAAPMPDHPAADAATPAAEASPAPADGCELVLQDGVPGCRTTLMIW